MTNPTPTPDLEKLLAELHQLESDVQFYSGNEANGSLAVLRKKAEIAALAPRLATENLRIRRENEWLRDDLTKSDWEVSCEGCGAPLFEGDDYVSDPDGCSGCWASMTDLPSKRQRPCYAYRVGKRSAALSTTTEQDHG